MKWVDKTAEGQTLIEEELNNIRKVETDYEGSALKSIEFADKRGTKILRITGGTYGDAVRLWIPESADKKEDE
jgi:hypothetical protein